ncbi:pyridoxamine 5'-phosphate oxidase family protein [Sulfurimonas sp. HSL-1716]|uniref:pyridoxamine 5'-phosphate oxidase family protein n=1 Tax=Hydrocurvibacter sulfurireducens TaxID=3131937 RepID=UPI0031F7A67F
MNKHLEKIVSFLEKHHTLSLATCKEGAPSSCTLFYAYDKEKNAFIVASDRKTKHIQNVLSNPKVSGSVHLETDIVGKIQGVQFEGVMLTCEDEAKSYFKRFPYALAMNPTLWRIEVEYFKMTDNNLGFGKKLIWEKAQASV